MASLPAVATATNDGATWADPNQSADFASVLAPDGTFVGASGVSGTIDASGWTLVSDLAEGEAPRFVRANGGVSPAVAGPWSPLGQLQPNENGNSVSALAISGNILYVGGSFVNAGSVAQADRIAKWNGSAWSALGSNVNGDNGAIPDGFVAAIAISGANVYVGGTFQNVRGIPVADFAAKWNGTAWSALSPSPEDAPLNGPVFALAVSGADLYAGGDFVNVEFDPEADYVAKWDGSHWSQLGALGENQAALEDTVRALAVSGTDLYVSGDFFDVMEIDAADFIAKWSGTAWSALGAWSDGNGAINGNVLALRVSGANLYAGGLFTNADEIPEADYIAKWSGAAWTALGSNGSGDGALNGKVSAIGVAGSNVYAGGLFTDTMGQAEADNIAVWTGSTWSALGSNGAGDGAVNNQVLAIAITPTDLFIGGTFTNVSNWGAADYVAKWSLGTNAVRKPDGRIRIGTAAYAGNNTYNTTGAGQSRSGSIKKGHSITFELFVENDGVGDDIYSLKATGAAVNGYVVTYFEGDTNVTAAVVAGTYQTPNLAPGQNWYIRAVVKVKAPAAAGSSVTRKVTFTSTNATSKKDVVKFVVKRKS